MFTFSFAHSLISVINAIASTMYRNSNCIDWHVQTGKRYIVHCIIQGTKAYHHGNTSRLQKEFEVYRLVRPS